MKPQLLTELLAKARSEELGLFVATNNPKGMQIDLDNHRRAIGDFADLIICIPAKPNSIFITHRSVDLDVR